MVRSMKENLLMCKRTRVVAADSFGYNTTKASTTPPLGSNRFCHIQNYMNAQIVALNWIYTCLGNLLLELSVPDLVRGSLPTGTCGKNGCERAMKKIFDGVVFN